jgi:hypothetical protein
MNIADTIVADARAARRRMYDTAMSQPYSPALAARAGVIEGIRVNIEPTPRTENGPVVISTPDTASARLYARDILHAIAAPIAANHGVTFTFRSDTYVEINHR